MYRLKINFILCCLIGPVMRTLSNMLMLGGGGNASEPQTLPQPQQEVWDTCALKMSLKESLTWPPFQKGFSLGMWVCLSEGQTNRFCLNMPLYNLETGRHFSAIFVKGPSHYNRSQYSAVFDKTHPCHGSQNDYFAVCVL